MNIGKTAELSGIPPKTIRYYESVGLIASARRRQNGYRDYSERDVETLRFINRARNLGFSVDNCRDLLALYEDRERASADVKALTLGHIQRIEHKIAELEGMRKTLSRLAEKCHGDERPECPILDDLAALSG